MALEEEALSLRYSLFSEHENSISAVQQSASKLILEHFPSPPCRVLEVGMGLPSLSLEFMRLGYKVTCITLEAAQEKYTKKISEEGVLVFRGQLEDFCTSAESFDAILFTKSAQYLSPLDLFSKSSEILVAGGEIIVLDEFAIDLNEPGKSKLHLIKHFIALGGRFGFEVVERLNLSSMAEPALDYGRDGVKKDSDRPLKDLGLSTLLRGELNRSNQADREKYAAGHYGRELLRFRKSLTPIRWRLGEITDIHREKMLSLFSSCFGHEMGSKHWDWKYAEGRGQAIGVWQGKELIAHYGGITRDILFLGQLQKGLWPCDVMVKQEGRGSLSRTGPFFLATATFLESYQGYGNKHLVALGFPSERHNKLAKRLGFYYDKEVDRMVEISWAPMPCKPGVWTEIRKLGCDDSHKEVANRIWHKMSLDFSAGLIGVRDWKYLKHRYFDHPDKHYEVYLVRNRISKHPRGLIVLRRYEHDCELLDLIAPIGEMHKLIDQARKIAGCMGAGRLYCWTAAHYSPLFESTGGKACDLGISIPTISWTAGLRLEQISQRCWLMGGDTDFR